MTQANEPRDCVETAIQEHDAEPPAQRTRPGFVQHRPCSEDGRDGEGGHRDHEGDGGCLGTRLCSRSTAVRTERLKRLRGSQLAKVSSLKTPRMPRPSTRFSAPAGRYPTNHAEKEEAQQVKATVARGGRATHRTAGACRWRRKPHRDAERTHLPGALEYCHRARGYRELWTRALKRAGLAASLVKWGQHMRIGLLHSIPRVASAR